MSVMEVFGRIRPGGMWRRAVLASLCACLAVPSLAVPAAQAKPFGITSFSVEATERTAEETETTTDGEKGPLFVNVPYKVPFTRAGGHPWAMTVKLEFTGEDALNDLGETVIVPTGDPKDVLTSLPPGLLGDPMAVPRCSLTQVTTGSVCPADTQIGVYAARLQGGKELIAPIVDVAAEAGQSAEFAFENPVKADTPLLTAHLVRTEEDGVPSYGFRLVSDNLPLIGIQRIEATVWGVPADPSHDRMRGMTCRRISQSESLNCEGGNQASGVEPVPFLTWPTDCSAGPESFTISADSWEEAGVFSSAESTLPAVTGCEALRFEPTLEVHPDTLLADEPVELGVNLNVPLNETPESTATPQLRDSTITLPEGMSVSPSVVDGVRACEAEGPEGINITGSESEKKALSGELQLAPGKCPAASTLGTAEAITPFLPVPVKGHIYLARPQCGGAKQEACTEADAADGKLYRLYLELGGESGELALTGIHFKVPLETEANLETGQLTTRTLGTPQAPFSELKIHLNGGPRAPIDNPATCGPAITTSDFTPWSAPGRTPQGLLVGGTPDAEPSSYFKVEGCGTPPGLRPGFTAGTVSPQAGQYSSFTLDLSRQDREQYIRGVQLQTPPGLLGMLSSVPLCGEPQADDGTCPQASNIGTTRVASGAGSHPFEIEGEVFLTGPYEGAPFGLSIVTHVVAGPFNLGVVVVRARIQVNPQTSALTVTTDETGPYKVPEIVFGVPLRLKRITVDIDRHDFMFNPTGCEERKITAKISGFEGAVSEVSSPLAAAGCAGLAFKPQFTASTSGHTSRANGASLDVKLSYPAGSLGKEANIAKTKVDLPKQLPSRLTTLQKACPAARFEANPASCPAGSIVGIVRATTPVLPVGLSGPVYFVSHGGEQFPSLIIVLQGDGVRVDLTGTTFISKAGVTSSTFNSVPDVPVETFELYLPQGPDSALAANGNLCKEKSKLKMPTAFVAQNGAVVKQSTAIAVTGCATGKAAKTARRARAARRTSHGRRLARTRTETAELRGGAR